MQRLCLIGIFQKNLLNKEGIEPLMESLWLSSPCLPLVKAGASLHRHSPQQLPFFYKAQILCHQNLPSLLSSKSDCLGQGNKFPQNPKCFGLGGTLKTISSLWLVPGWCEQDLPAHPALPDGFFSGVWEHCRKMLAAPIAFPCLAVQQQRLFGVGRHLQLGEASSPSKRSSRNCQKTTRGAAAEAQPSAGRL